MFFCSKIVASRFFLVEAELLQFRHVVDGTRQLLFFDVSVPQGIIWDGLLLFLSGLVADG